MLAWTPSASKVNNAVVRHNYWVRARLYRIADPVWTEKALRTRVQRQFGSATAYTTLDDPAALADLEQNGTLLIAIPD